MMAVDTIVSGWTKNPRIKSSVYRPEHVSELQSIISANGFILASGNYRSYADSSLLPVSIDMKRLDKILGFDEDNGIIIVEAGITLDELFRVIIPKGWFFAVTPGTRYVTVGGCVASDVHGKNHEKYGSFQNTVASLTLINAQGELVTCTPKHKSDLFYASFGGMGLTGVVYAVAIQLKKLHTTCLEVVTKSRSSLAQLLETLDNFSKKYDNVMAWIDMSVGGKQLGRGIVTGSRDCSNKTICLPKNKQVKIPFDMPSFLLTPLTMRIGSWLRFHVLSAFRTGKSRQHLYKAYYPQDDVLDWNRLYGRRGFIQYQCTLPYDRAILGFEAMLRLLQKHGQYGALTSVKRLGNGKNEYLSYPSAGYVLAIDLPITSCTREVFAELDKIALTHNGRLYLSKDGCMSTDTFKKMYPNSSKFLQVKKKYDPQSKFRSLQSTRLELTS